MKHIHPVEYCLACYKLSICLVNLRSIQGSIGLQKGVLDCKYKNYWTLACCENYMYAKHQPKISVHIYLAHQFARNLQKSTLKITWIFMNFFVRMHLLDFHENDLTWSLSYFPRIPDDFPKIFRSCYGGYTLKLLSKGNSGRKKVKLKWKSLTNAKKRAITDLSAPSGSREIPFRSQEFDQDGRHHFVCFQPHFHLNMTSRTQSCMTMKKWKCDILGIFLFVLFETLQDVRTQQKNYASF